MSAIDQRIDAAVLGAKERAAEFDERWSPEGCDFTDLVVRAGHNLKRAHAKAVEGESAADIKRDLYDAFNLIALAIWTCEP